MATTITLTSDLGQRDPSVARLKGSLLTLAPDANVLDLSHDIPPFSVTEGALFLHGALPHFPEGTVHVVGVGAGPRPLAAQSRGQTILCPDNGLLTLLDLFDGIGEVRELPLDDSLRDRERQVLFTREVFAPAAASLARGEALTDLGPPVEDWQRLDIAQPSVESRKIEGRIIHVDHFGNVVTNILPEHLDGKSVDRIASGHFTVQELHRSYTDVAKGKPLALIGQSGFLELAYNGKHANEIMKLTPGFLVTVFLSEAS